MEILKQDVKGAMTVIGEGEVRVKPDVAHLNVGVVTESKSAREALSENASRMERLLGRIKGLGIPASDLQTVGLTVSPIVDYDDKSPTRGKIIRYQVEDTLSVRVAPSRVGAALDEAIEAGGNMAGQLTFGLRDDSAERTMAMKLAMQAALRDAELISATMGVEVIGINSIDVSHGEPTLSRTKMIGRESAATPVEPGSLTITARASVVYAISKHR